MTASNRTPRTNARAPPPRSEGRELGLVHYADESAPGLVRVPVPVRGGRSACPPGPRPAAVASSSGRRAERPGRGGRGGIVGAAPPWGKRRGSAATRGTRRRTMKVSVCARGWKIARGAMVRVGRGRDARGIVSCRASGHFRTDGGRRRAPASTPSHSALTRARSAATNSPRVLNPSAATGAGGGGRAEPSVDGSVSNHAVTASRTRTILREVQRSARRVSVPWESSDGSENTGGGQVP